MKKIHIILTREQFEELQKLKTQIFKDTPNYTYEQYLKDEERNPSYCLFG